MRWIFHIIKTNYKKSFDFKGRQGRKEFWIFFLFSIFVFYLLVFLIFRLDYYYLAILIPVIMFPLFSSSTRRLHDGEKGNYKTLIGIYFGLSFLFVSLVNIKIGKIPIFGLLWLIIFIIFQCRDSNPKVNGYGKLEKFK